MLKRFKNLLLLVWETGNSFVKREGRGRKQTSFPGDANNRLNLTLKEREEFKDEVLKPRVTPTVQRFEKELKSVDGKNGNRNGVSPNKTSQCCKGQWRKKLQTTRGVSHTEFHRY